MAKRSMDMSRPSAPQPKKELKKEEAQSGCAKGCVVLLLFLLFIIVVSSLAADSVLTPGTGG